MNSDIYIIPICMLIFFSLIKQCFKTRVRHLRYVVINRMLRIGWISLALIENRINGCKRQDKKQKHTCYSLLFNLLNFARIDSVLMHLLICDCHSVDTWKCFLYQYYNFSTKSCLLFVIGGSSTGLARTGHQAALDQCLRSLEVEQFCKKEERTSEKTQPHKVRWVRQC